MSRSVAVGFVFLSALAWAMSGITLQLPSSDAPTVLVLGLRSIVVALALLTVGGWGNLRISKRGVLAAFFGLASTALFVVAARAGSVVVAVTLYNSGPVFAALIERLVLKREVKVVAWLAAIATAIGVALITGASERSALLPVVAALLSGLSSAACGAAMLGIRENERAVSLGLASGVAAVVCLFLVLGSGEPTAGVSVSNVGWSLANGIIATIAMWSISRGMSGSLSLTAISVIQSLEVPANAVLAFLILGAGAVSLGDRAIGGCLIVFFSALIVSASKEKKIEM